MMRKGAAFFAFAFFSSPLLSLVSVDPASWVGQYGAGKSPAQAAKDYWNATDQWGREVDGYYHAFLHRDADAAGRAFWIGRFDAGADEGTIIQGFLTSDEYTRAHAGDVPFVESLYQDVLNRSADVAGEQYWRGLLAAGASHGEIAQGFLQSTEALARAAESLYAAFLHRPGEVSGINFWVGELQSGRETLGQVAQAFLASDEFYADSKKTR